ncbi:hypothetical protein NFI96_005886 [Prochilodus magdalenae]|nr:hypothetical protein NFI96_005886 [Prochilodus magdalenae]
MSSDTRLWSPPRQKRDSSLKILRQSGTTRLQSLVAKNFQGQVSAAISYLTYKLSQGISSNYSLCLVTYALSLAKSPYAATAMKELMNRAQMQNDVPMWSSPDSSLADSWQPRSADIEMAAYALLSLYKQGSVEQGLSLLKWLSQQRNHLGGYGSTQAMTLTHTLLMLSCRFISNSDTVIALQALSAYATLSSMEHIDLAITVTDPMDIVATFTINPTNYLLYQSSEVGISIHYKPYTLTTFYNVDTKGLSRRRRDAYANEAFELDINVMDYNMYNVYINICFRLSEHQELSQTGMAILDVGLLTGFTLHQDGIPVNSLVRQVETSPGKVILYLDSVTKNTECVEVPTSMEVKVSGVQDAVVTIYDYYEPRRRTVRTYTSEGCPTVICNGCPDHRSSRWGSVGVSFHSKVRIKALTMRSQPSPDPKQNLDSSLQTDESWSDLGLYPTQNFDFVVPTNSKLGIVQASPDAGMVLNVHHSVIEQSPIEGYMFCSSVRTQQNKTEEPIFGLGELAFNMALKQALVEVQTRDLDLTILPRYECWVARYEHWPLFGQCLSSWQFVRTKEEEPDYHVVSVGVDSTAWKATGNNNVLPEMTGHSERWAKQNFSVYMEEAKSTADKSYEHWARVARYQHRTLFGQCLSS